MTPMSFHTSPAKMIEILIKRDYSRLPSKNAQCRAIGAKLGLHHKTIMMISNGGYCGENTKRELRKMLGIKPEPKRPKRIRDRNHYRTEKDRQIVNSVFPTERDKADALLLMALGRTS